VDDDPLKTGRVIHGIKVFSGNGSLADVCRDHAVSEILLSARNISKERLGEIKELCDASDIELKRALLKIEPFEDLLN
jgi:FlaA1/EpsC-like NDP-sugar epimerase